MNDIAIVLCVVFLAVLLWELGVLAPRQGSNPRHVIPPPDSLPELAGWGVRVTHRTGEWYVNRRGHAWSWSAARHAWIARRVAPTEVLALAGLGRKLT